MPGLVNKRWRVAGRLPESVDLALKDYPPFMRQVLHNRGYSNPEDASRYLQAGQPPGADPFCLLGVPEAVDRILQAIREEEPVVVYGDYDADGVTATALLVLALKSLGARAREYIPNRFDEGYGLNNEALAFLHAEGVRLVITVDCGIRSPDEADFAAGLGLDLIITDHHQPGSRLPRALAVINPRQDGDPYPEKELAGVGIAYKLASALFARLDPPGVRAEDYLDLVALGTVSDLAPLRGENRALVRAGIEQIRHPKRQGLMALIGAAGLYPQRITTTDLGYALGPRLNAAGRLASALASLNLLMTDDVHLAGHLAQELDNHNRQRQKITQEIQVQAEEMALAADPDALLLFAAHPDFNSGVVGLAASRLAELYYRPAIVAQLGDEFTRGSCRSIRELHITQALDQCADLLVRHGGHAAAAGFTVRNENLPALVERLHAYVAAQLADKDLRPVLEAESELALEKMTPDKVPWLFKWLDQFEPCGFGNPHPKFVSRSLRLLKSRPVGRDNGHLKLTLADGAAYFDAIAFRQGNKFGQLPPLVDILYCFEKNEYNGQYSLQLNIKDIKPAGQTDD